MLHHKTPPTPKRNDFWYSLCTLPLACKCFKVGPGKASSRECEKGAKRNSSSSESLFCRLFSRFLRWTDFENCQLLTGIPPLQTDKINLDSLRNLYFTQKLFVPISCSQIKNKNWFVFKGRHFIIQIAFAPPHLWTTDYTMITSGNNNPCVLDLDGKMFLCMRIFWPGCQIPGEKKTFPAGGMSLRVLTLRSILSSVLSFDYENFLYRHQKRKVNILKISISFHNIRVRRNSYSLHLCEKIKRDGKNSISEHEPFKLSAFHQLVNKLLLACSTAGAWCDPKLSDVRHWFQGKSLFLDYMTQWVITRLHNAHPCLKCS